MTWTEFLHSRAAVACDFATIETVTLRRLDLLFFIDIPTRTVYLGGITEHPTAPGPLAKRWIGTLRRELLDRTLVWNRRQLQRVVTDYIDHYNQHRPHRALGQRPPAEECPTSQLDHFKL